MRKLRRNVLGQPGTREEARVADVRTDDVPEGEVSRAGGGGSRWARHGNFLISTPVTSEAFLPSCSAAGSPRHAYVIRQPSWP